MKLLKVAENFYPFIYEVKFWICAITVSYFFMEFSFQFRKVGAGIANQQQFANSAGNRNSRFTIVQLKLSVTSRPWTQVPIGTPSIAPQTREY